MIKHYSYRTSGTCSKNIEFDIVDGKLRNISFQGGCNGNLKGISSLCEGLEVNDVINRLSDIKCNAKTTSCPDQLAKALKQALSENVLS